MNSPKASDTNRVHLEYARLRGEAAAAEVLLVARWREFEELRTGERPTCDHKTALALAEMAILAGRLA